MRALLVTLVASTALASAAQAAVDLQPRRLGPRMESPKVVAVGDVSGDGAPDVVAFDERCRHDLSVISGRWPQVRDAPPVRDCPAAAVVTDVDRDGNADLVTTGTEDEQGQVTVLYGGRHRVRRRIATGTSAGLGVAVADFDGDGRRDIAVTDFDPEFSEGRNPPAVVRILLARGRRAFAVPVTVARGGAQPSVLAAGDLDGDGRADLIAAGGRLLVLRGKGDGTFRAPARTGVKRANSLWFGRFDGDARPDLVVTTDTRMWIIRGGRHLRAVPLGPPYGNEVPSVSAIVAADLNGDGRTDVVLHIQDEIELYEQRRNGRLRPPVHYRTGYDGEPAIVDLNQDGRLDVLDVSGDGGARAFLNRGDAPRARLLLSGGAIPYVPADRTLRVPVHCSAGVSGCRGRLSVGRRRTYFDLLPGQRDVIPLSARRFSVRPLQAVAHTEVGAVRARLYAHAATAAERRAACEQPRTDTLARSPSARVFAFADDPFVEQPVGCLRTLGGWVPLPVFDGPVATRGRWVAFNQRDCGEPIEGCDHKIDLFDLRARRSLGSTLNEMDDPSCTIGGGGDCGAFTIGSILVNQLGALAWIDCPYATRAECPRRKHAPYEVFVLDSQGKRRIDNGLGIDPHSLRLDARGRSVSWTRAGTHRSERLRGRPRRGLNGLRPRFGVGSSP